MEGLHFVALMLGMVALGYNIYWIIIGGWRGYVELYNGEYGLDGKIMAWIFSLFGLGCLIYSIM